MPRLSVALCIPTIPGREKYLRRALDSVNAQTRRPDQLLVQADPDREGAAATRNRLLRLVDSDVVMWLDDDDWLKENHVRTLMRVLEQERDVDLVYPTPVVFAEGRRGSQLEAAIRAGIYPAATTHQSVFPVSPWGLRWDSEKEAHLRHRGSFIPITHAVRTDMVRRAGGFPPARTLESGRLQGEDERYLIALLDAGARFAHIDRKTWVWDANGNGTAGLGTMTKGAGTFLSDDGGKDVLRGTHA